MTSPRNSNPKSCPTARPVASGHETASSLVSAAQPTDSAHDIFVAAVAQAATDPASAFRQRSHRINQLVDSLAPLDWQVTADVARFRLMSGSQLQRRFFDGSSAGGRAARRLLLRLVNADVLARLERRVGGKKGGSSGYVYVLGLSGQKLLNQGRRARRHREPGWPFLKHTLAISELYVQLCEEALTGTDTNLVVFDPEPLCWRSQLGVPGNERLHLRPDAYVVLDRGRRRQFWFVEVDLGTESRPTLRKKMQQYETWLETGFEQQRLGGVFPRVLWHTVDLERRAVLEQLAERASGPAGLHVIAGLLDSSPQSTEPP